MSKVDEVQSGGDKVVKSARKELVRAVEAELRKVDEGKERVWRAQSTVLEKEVDGEFLAFPFAIMDTNLLPPPFPQEQMTAFPFRL